ncbi:hypothetical protein GGS23DRAFT_550947 [Durotheca rogersii]|uniref:uncharacterized protein n=1 Tax=Durotheca rogersii TaxID=419775 RepID=UPI002220CE58|nr:uncharacterized protein GGS23DRAFT_550947 [Durotheca rogersii]KAI5866517.1 hypothetical protein GGS23DRAFT_550947 [Durotheca rogersii]
MADLQTHNLDLTLPDRAPELLKEYAEGIDTGSSSFAIYSLVPDMTASQIEEISNIPQQEYEEYEYPGRLARPAKPAFDFAGKTLKDVVAAHAAMDKNIIKPGDGGAAEIAWYPNVFVVLTKRDDLADHGMLLVYAQREHPDGVGRMDRFFFDPKDMFAVLTDVMVGSHGMDVYKKWRDIDGQEFLSIRKTEGRA